MKDELKEGGLLCAEELLQGVIGEWQPPREMSVSEWADAHFYLSPEYAAEHGKWRTMAFQREPLDCFANTRISQIVVRASTQMMKTAIIQICTAYAIDQDPGPILILHPDESSAADFSKERIAPMIRDTPRLRALVKDHKTSKSDNTIRQKWFRGGLLAIASARQPGNLSRRAIRYLFVDEEDKFPASAGKEGDPYSLATKRQATFRNRKKSIRCCSPTFKGSAIDRAYARSDQREYHVPCPGCGHFQSMMGWKHWNNQVHWDRKLPTREEQAKSARYLCENCSLPWDDAMRYRAVNAGRWIGGAPQHGIAGFWINELYSPWKQLWEIVLDYLIRKDNALEFQTWVNTVLAENWEMPGERLEWERLVERRENYTVGMVPDRGLYLTAAVDVHRADGGRLEAEVLAHGENGETWGIEYEKIPGDISYPSPTWERLTDFINRARPHECGGEIYIDRVFIDSGDGATTHDVYGWVASQRRDRVFAIKGRQHYREVVSGPKAVESDRRGKKIDWGFIFKTIDVSYFKHLLRNNLISRKPTDEERAKGFQFPAGYCHFPISREFGDEYFQQLCSEQLRPEKNRSGVVTHEFRSDGRPNHALDVRIYNMAAAWDAKVHKFQAKHWSMLRNRVESTRKPDEVAVTHTPPPRRSLPVMGRINL